MVSYKWYLETNLKTNLSNIKGQDICLGLYFFLNKYAFGSVLFLIRFMFGMCLKTISINSIPDTILSAKLFVNNDSIKSIVTPDTLASDT